MSSRMRLSSLVPAGVIVESTAESGETIVVHAQAWADEQACPLCGKRSSRVHSRHVRTAADLPCAGGKVVLQLVTRRALQSGGGGPPLPERSLPGASSAVF